MTKLERVELILRRVLALKWDERNGREARDLLARAIDELCEENMKIAKRDRDGAGGKDVGLSGDEPKEEGHARSRSGN